MKRILLSILITVVLLISGCGAPTETASPDQPTLPTEVVAEETPSEDTTTEKVPSEEVVTEETATEETAAEEVPSEEATTEETATKEEVPEPEPARFVLSNIRVTLSENTSETSYSITIDVRNTGGLKGTYSLVSKVDNERLDSIKVELSPNQKKTIILAKAQAKVSSLAEQYKNQEINDQTCKVSVGFSSKTITFPELESKLQLLSTKGINWGDVELEITGQVKNISGASLKDVEAVVEFFNSKGKLLYSSSKPIYRNSLEPDQTSAFEVVGIVEAQDVQRYMVYFRFKSGERILTDYSE